VEETYWVGGVGRERGGVSFDGFKSGVLLEAKGPGYARFFSEDLAPRKWFAVSGIRKLRDQAARQLQAAKGMPIQWHVAEEKAADAIRAYLEEEGLGAIKVVHTPALP
jgi:hypothetical protein